MMRRFTAASLLTPSVMRLSSIAWRRWSCSPYRGDAPAEPGRAATLLTIASPSGYGWSASRMSSFTVPAP